MTHAVRETWKEFMAGVGGFRRRERKVDQPSGAFLSIRFYIFKYAPIMFKKRNGAIVYFTVKNRDDIVITV